MERNFLGSEGRAGVIMAYREWGGCCRNPGGVPSAGLRRDKNWGPDRGVEVKRRTVGRSVWGAARTNHRSELLIPPSAKQKPSRTAGLLLGGRGWIRTTEVVDNRFTVCSLWPLGNPPKFYPTKCPRFAVVLCGDPVFLSPRRGQSARSVELVNGIEPSTC